MSAPVLKSCPFCGEQPYVLPENPEEEGNAWTAVSCLNVRCPAQPEVKHYSDFRAVHRRGAFRKWNRRHD